MGMSAGDRVALRHDLTWTGEVTAVGVDTVTVAGHGWEASLPCDAVVPIEG